jgi:Arc/MetJ family transcription regulator
MASHMKTTIVISDALLAEANKVIRRDKTTLKNLVNEGLREVLAKRKTERKPFKLRDLSYGGDGLHPDAAHLSMQEIIAMANDRT